MRQGYEHCDSYKDRLDGKGRKLLHEYFFHDLKNVYNKKIKLISLSQVGNCYHRYHCHKNVKLRYTFVEWCDKYKELGYNII